MLKIRRELDFWPAESPAHFPLDIPAGPSDPFGRYAGWMEVPAEPAEAPSSLAQVSVDAPPDASYTPSPEDWRDEIFYSVMIDRFNRTAPFTAWGSPIDGRTRHGGNIRGLIQRLDYLQGLGVTTILVNPIVMNPPAGYHQYWTIHFLAVDPQIGTMADFRDLVAQAHRRGMRIVLDMVFNHTAPIIEYAGGFEFGPRKDIQRWRYPLKPVELARAEHFSLRGDINDWNDQEQIEHGDLPGGINRLNTDNPATQDILLKIAKWWIKETDVDGFRLDVYKHVSKSFWSRFFPHIREYAAKLGKKNFLLVGEIYDGNPANLVPEMQNGQLDSAYNYPAYFWNQSALRGQAPTSALEANFLVLSTMLGDAHPYMVNFIGNHDRPRFLAEDGPEGLLQFAMAHTLLTVGIPYIYYGDEQAFRHVSAREWLDLEVSRDDMNDDFDTAAPVYRLVRAVAGARQAIPALRHGRQYVRWSDPSGPGIYAFSRIHEDQEVLVILNSAGFARSAEMWVDKDLTPAGSSLIDVLDPGYVVAARSAQGEGSMISVQVPAYGVRILSRSKPRQP